MRCADADLQMLAASHGVQGGRGGGSVVFAQEVVCHSVGPGRMRSHVVPSAGCPEDLPVRCTLNVKLNIS